MSPLTRAAARVANRPSALHQAERLSSMLGGPALGHERGATRPLPAHAEPKKHAGGQELPEILREPARRGKHRVDDDAEHQRAGAAESIRNPAKHQTAGGAGDERDGSQDASRRC